MSRLDSNPRVKELARDLKLRWRSSPVESIREHALNVVAKCLEEFPKTRSLEDLRVILSEHLSVCVEIARTDADLERIARDYRFSEAERRRLIREFDHEEVEGWLVFNPAWRRGLRKYVAIVDARGDRESRAYFTAWHEIAHLIVTPPQLAFEGFRRSIPVDRKKDPVESVVDAITGELAFYPPFVRPVVEEEVAREGRVSFEVIESVRQRVAPEASLYSAAIATVRLSPVPVLLVQVRRAYKKSERRALSSSQVEFDLGESNQRLTPKLRAVDVIPSGESPDLSIFNNMRVPEDSVLTRTYETLGEVTLEANENQSWWETSADGPLPARPLLVEAARRGSYVYGLISPVGAVPTA